MENYATKPLRLVKKYNDWLKNGLVKTDCMIYVTQYKYWIFNPLNASVAFI